MLRGVLLKCRRPSNARCGAPAEFIATQTVAAALQARLAKVGNQPTHRSDLPIWQIPVTIDRIADGGQNCSTPSNIVSQIDRE